MSALAVVSVFVNCVLLALLVAMALSRAEWQENARLLRALYQTALKGWLAEREVADAWREVARAATKRTKGDAR